MLSASVQDSEVFMNYNDHVDACDSNPINGSQIVAVIDLVFPNGAS
jgi:hypothetical protein